MQGAAAAALPLRERHRLDTHRRLLQAAVAEFERVGVAKARVEHICRAAGVTRPTFYAHFSSKEAVLGELQRNSAERVARLMLPQLADVSSIGNLADRLVDGLFAVSTSASPRLRREIASFFVRNQRMADLEGTELFESVLAHVTAARERGELVAHQQPRELVRLVFIVLNGFLVADADDLEPGRVGARKTLALLLHALRMPDGSDA